MNITVTISQSPASLSFEVGSFKEVVGTLQEHKAVFQDFCSVASELSPADDSSGEAETAATAPAQAGADAAPAKRGRKAKNQPDPATAVAPAPIPAPSSAPPAPPAPPAPVAVAPALQAQVADAVQDGKIPPFLERTAAPAPALAPPPLLPAAPSIAPTPPVSLLAPKITAEVERRLVGSPDGGEGMRNWIVQTAVTAGFVSRPAPDQWPTYEETLAVLPFQPDDKLAPIAQALQLA